jgi:DNA-binding NarL/FixJ family response regulator
LIVATDRRPVLSLFGDARDRHGAVEVKHTPLSARPLDVTDGAIARAHAAVVDASSDHRRALEVCRELRAARPTLPLLGVLCCPYSTNPYYIQELGSAGVESLLDLHTTEAEALHMIRCVVDGERVLHVRVLKGDGDRRAPHGHDHELSPRELRLLELLSVGLGDQEMGAELFLSPHTVKHRVEQLRMKLALPNRIALAAWAGRNGIAPAPRGREEAGYAVA